VLTKQNLQQIGKVVGEEIETRIKKDDRWLVKILSDFSDEVTMPEVRRMLEEVKDDLGGRIDDTKEGLQGDIGKLDRKLMNITDNQGEKLDKLKGMAFA